METKRISESKIEGDLEYDGEVIFENDIEITGHLRVRIARAVKSIYVRKTYTVYEFDIVGGFQEVGGPQKVGGPQEVGEFQNMSFELIDVSKIKTKHIVFTSSYYHERKFWLAQLSNIDGIDEFKQALQDNNKCWEELIGIAKKYKTPILSYKYYVAAVRQAIEIMLS